MARNTIKSGVLFTGAAMALVISGLSTPAFAQRADDNRGRGEARRTERAAPPAQGNFGQRIREMREQQREAPRAQPQPRGQAEARGNGQRSEARPAQASSQPRPAWSGNRERGGDRGASEAMRRDNDRTPAWRSGGESWRDNDRRNDGRTTEGWRSGDRRDGDRYRDNDRRDGDRWRDGDRRDYRSWDRNRWRGDSRYDWQRYRDRNRSAYRIGRYYAPYSNYSYRRLGIGFTLGSMFYGNRYWIDDPWQYRLPEVYGPYRWVRYYDDVLLVDIYSGEVVDVIYDFFW